MTGRGRIAVVAIAVVMAVQGVAVGVTDSLAQYFKKVADSGLVISGRAMWDGSARVDTYADGKVTRHTFDRTGKTTSAVLPDEYDAKMLESVKVDAATAARSAAKRADPREVFIRAVTLVDEDGLGVYCVSIYDANKRFFGCHRFVAADGKWDGWSDSIGEPDPLAK